MNISLTDKLKKYIATKVASGDYSTNSEVVREAIRLLQAQDRERRAALRELRKDIQIGIDELDRGERIPAEQVFRELRQAAHARRRRKSA